MVDGCNSWALLVGRLLLGQIFLLSGVMKVLNWTTTAEHMAGEGMVAVPVFLFLAIVLEIGGGLSTMLGVKAHLCALALALFLVPVTLVFHDFWRYEGAALQQQMQHFLKNLALMGGLVTLAAAGAGRFSLDALRQRDATADRHEMAEASAPSSRAPVGGNAERQ